MTSVLIAKIAIAVSLIGIAIYRDYKNEKEYQENKWYFDKLRTDVYEFMEETRKEKEPPTVHLNAGHESPKSKESMSYDEYYNWLENHIERLGTIIHCERDKKGRLVTVHSCPNCMHEIESKDAIFCSHCGKRLRKE